MDLSIIENKLKKSETLTFPEIENVLDYVALNMRAFYYACVPLSDLEIFILLKNTGGFVMFKRIKGFIVEDKADKSYSCSRDAVGIDMWNIHSVYKLGFVDEQLSVKRVNTKQIKGYLQGVVKPSRLKYVVGVEDENKPAIINVDNGLMKGLAYSNFISCMRESYVRMVGLPNTAHVNTNYLVVSYSTNKE